MSELPFTQTENPQATEQLSATLIIAQDKAQLFSAHRISGTLSLIDPHRAKLALDKSVKVAGVDVGALFLTAKYTRWLTDIGGQQQVSVFQTEQDADQGKASLTTEANIEFNIVSPSQRRASAELGMCSTREFRSSYFGS